MVQVTVKGNNIERAIRQLKKKLMKEGILRELRLREAYEKPSLKRQRKHKESLRRVAKERRMRRRRERA